MAYLRKEKELIEVDYPIEVVWAAISKVVETLQWTVEESDDTIHLIKIKTKSNIMAYASTLTVAAASFKEKTTQISVSAETPVTTITGIIMRKNRLFNNGFNGNTDIKTISS